MGYFDPDLYNQPEKFDLEILGELNDPNASYDYYDFVVWKHKDGRIFYGEDSGCSCPSPFESFTSLESAEEAKTVEEFEAAVKEYFNSLNYGEKDAWDWDSDKLSSSFQSLRADAVELIIEVTKILEGR